MKSGITNLLSNTEVAYDTAGNPLPFDPEGLDTEALVRLNDGTFWLGEEYAPSLVHVAAVCKAHWLTQMPQPTKHPAMYDS
jgi:hypothetical protein